MNIEPLSKKISGRIECICVSGIILFSVCEIFRFVLQCIYVYTYILYYIPQSKI